MTVYPELGDVIDSGRKYRVIYADPPWKYVPNIGDRRVTIGGRTVKGPRSRHDNSSPDARYKTMSPAEIAAMPVREIAREDAALFMWCVRSELTAALKVVEAWGFEERGWAFVWVKTGKRSCRPAPGQGFYTITGAEVCLRGARGSVPRAADDVHEVQEAPRGRHSAKPLKIRDEVARLTGEGPRIELFARDTSRPEWDYMGRQAVPRGGEARQTYITHSLGGGA